MGLAVYVDGAAMPEAEARGLWQRFSDWMEENKGDLAGFASREGFASVHPGVENGRPVLYASKSTAQRPYAPVSALAGAGGSPEERSSSAATRPGSSARSAEGPRGGSGGRHEPSNRGSGPPRKSKKSGRKRRI